jgi:uncharacterized lipoprotein NlpE involved in copper resistance
MKHALALPILMLALTGCDAQQERKDFAPAELTADVARAMCAEDQDTRAAALAGVSSKSEGRNLGEVSQEVHDQAATIAEKGCPKEAGAKPDSLKVAEQVTGG